MATNINGVKRGNPQNNKPQQTTNNNQSASSSLWDDISDFGSSFGRTLKGAANEVLDLGESAYQKAKSGAKTVYDYAKTGAEYLTLKGGSLVKDAGMPVAGELLELSLMSPKERDAQVRREGGQVLNAKQSRAKLDELGMKEGSNCHTQPDQMDLPTMVFGKDSKMTKEVNSNEMMQKIVKDWAKNGAKDKAILPFNTANANSFDLRMGIGYGQIVGLHLSEDGKYAEGYVEDVYDYDKHYNKGTKEESNFLKKGLSFGVQTVNDMAVDIQNKCILHNYRTLTPIRVKL